MKKILNFLFSMPFMAFLLVVLAVSMAAATFIESSSGPVAAKAVVYNAWWFELAILLIFINILANIFKFNLWRLKKLPILVFHLAFLVIILGAGITRYIGEEGMMSIREGEQTNKYLSSQTFFYAELIGQGEPASTQQAVLLSKRSKRQLRTRLKSESHKISFRSTDYTTGMEMSAQMTGQANPNQPDILKVLVEADGVKEELFVKGFANKALYLSDYEVNGIKIRAGFGAMEASLPFELKLVDFDLERYPGSNSPSSYASEVVLVDQAENIEEPHRIFMNNILKYKGFRFYQSHYDQDEKGTVLSVNNDALGTGVTYFGYFLMFLFIALAMIFPGTRFRKLIQSTRTPVAAIVSIFLITALSFSSLSAQTVAKKMDANEVKAFGEMWVQGSDGRFEPVNTLAQEIIRKVIKKNKYGDMSAEELWLNMLVDPVKWEGVKLFEIDKPEIARMLGVSGTKASFSDFFVNGNYALGQGVNLAFSKQPSERTGIDKELIKIDEKLNVFYYGLNGQLLRIFPDKNDMNGKWFDLTSKPANLPQEDSLFVVGSFSEYLSAMGSNDVAKARQYREAISKYQIQYGSEVIPKATKGKLEILYNKVLIFERLAPFYATVGLLFLIIQFMVMFRPAKWQKPISWGFTALVVVGFLLHSAGLAIRWYVSGHAPMSNGYESMIFVAWGTLLAGVLLIRRSHMAVALTAILAALSLLVAHLSWMSPEITNLVPVLKSVWLTVHVAVIMTSYSFLGLAALIGIVVLGLYASKTISNQKTVDTHIEHLTKLNQISLIVGLYLITIGCFLGAIWANEAWGRYWGWDPKETWALISILVYTFITHMHHIKGMNSSLTLNMGSVLGFSSILMTYFGVNYFLGGMHSYAGGEAPTLPTAAYVVLIVIVVLIYWAYFNQQRFQKKKADA